MKRRKSARVSVLVVDIGGTHIKCVASGHRRKIRFRSGPRFGPDDMMRKLLKRIEEWRYEVVVLGYPGVVRNGKILREPHNLGKGWVGFDFRAAFGRPVKLINDAAMQALGSYKNGTMLFLGFGTGLGSALIVDGTIATMELGHLKYSRKHTYEHVLGDKGRKRMGHRKWSGKVVEVVTSFQAALLPDDTVLGGGNTKKLKRLPAGTRRGSNDDAFRGGFRLWN